MNVERRLPRAAAAAVAIPAMMTVTAVAGGAVGAGVAEAQRIFGTVVLADDRTAAAGTIIVASDSTGTIVVRELASARGDYVMPLPRAGTFTLTARRVGSEPEVVRGVVADDGRDVRVRIVLARPIAPPPAPSARGAETCDLGSQPSAAAMLWEQLRTALATTAMAEQTRMFVGSWELSERVLDGNLRDTLSRSASTERIPLEVPVMPALAPDSTLRRGFVVESDDRVHYYVPSIATLGSDAFATRRCFALEPAPAAHPEWIGVHFRPAAPRTGVGDVEGDAWFDARTLEPRRIEYLYTGLPPAFAAARAGGAVQFRRLPTGHWTADEWAIRVPSGRYLRVFAYDTRGVPSGHGNVTLDGVRMTTVRLRELQVNGTSIFRRPQ